MAGVRVSGNVQWGGGATGPTGASGTDGTSPEVVVNSTTTGAPGSDADVANSGDTSNVLLDFTIPRGDVGAQGIQGDPCPLPPEWDPVDTQTWSTTSGEELDNVLSFPLVESHSYVFRAVGSARSADGVISYWEKFAAGHLVSGVTTQDASAGPISLPAHAGIVFSPQIGGGSMMVNVLGSTGIPLSWEGFIYKLRDRTS